MYEKMLELARMGHEGQKRRNNGEDYINHPIRVASKFQDDFRKTLAIAHDLFEDAPDFYETQVKPYFPQDVIDGLILLSREEDETYFDFIMRIIRSGNMAAMRVKYEDLTDNMSDLEEGSLKDKYRFARHLIKHMLWIDGELCPKTSGKG